MPGGWEWLIIIVVLVLLFGAKRLPDMARSVGQSARVFKGEMKGMRDDDGSRTSPPERPRTAELPPATGRSGQEYVGQEHRGQEYEAQEHPGQQYSGPPQNGPVSGLGTGDPQPTEPVRRDVDR